MASALVCDMCGKVFAGNYNVTLTGKWVAKTVGDVKLVYGAFRVLTEQERAAERGGKAIDCCDGCMKTLMDAPSMVTQIQQSNGYAEQEAG